MELSKLREETKLFIDNHDREDDLSDSPQEAVVSIKTDRGTDYKQYISVLDEIKAALS